MTSSIAFPDVTLREPRGYSPPAMTDALLVRRVLEGDASAFTELVDRHAPACLRFATRMLGDVQDAEEVTQEALLRAYRALPRYDSAVAFRTWLIAILANRCRSARLYRWRRERRIVPDSEAIARAAVEPQAGSVDTRDAIDRALASLDVVHREAFLLKHVESLSYDEMAVVTGAGVSALKMRVKRACDQLRAILERDYG